MTYGVNDGRRVFCPKHEEFHPADERCRWCEPPVMSEVEAWIRVVRMHQYLATTNIIPPHTLEDLRGRSPEETKRRILARRGVWWAVPRDIVNRALEILEGK